MVITAALLGGRVNRIAGNVLVFGLPLHRGIELWSLGLNLDLPNLGRLNRQQTITVDGQWKREGGGRGGGVVSLSTQDRLIVLGKTYACSIPALSKPKVLPLKQQ